MATTTEDLYLDRKLVTTLADRVTTEYGKTARLYEVAALIDTWPETSSIDIGEQEMLVEEIVEELAARDNGRRR